MAETNVGRHRREDGVEPTPALARALAERTTRRRTAEPEEVSE